MFIVVYSAFRVPQSALSCGTEKAWDKVLPILMEVSPNTCQRNKQSTPRHTDISDLLQGGHMQAQALKTALFFSELKIGDFPLKNKAKTLFIMYIGFPIAQIYKKSRKQKQNLF